MKREFLKNLGLEAEVVDKIMAEYGNSVEKLKNDLSSAKSDNLELENKVRDLEASTKDTAELETKIAELKEQLKTAKDEAETAKNEKTSYIKDTKLNAKLKEAKAKNTKVVASLLEGLEFDGEEFTNLEEKLQALKDGEDTSFLFELEDADEEFPPNVFKSTGINHSKGKTPDTEEAAMRAALGLELKGE